MRQPSRPFLILFFFFARSTHTDLHLAFGRVRQPTSLSSYFRRARARWSAWSAELKAGAAGAGMSTS